jgi:hypothetical protein
VVDNAARLAAPNRTAACPRERVNDAPGLLSEAQAMEITRALCDVARELFTRGSFDESTIAQAARCLIEQARLVAQATTSPVSPSETDPRTRR